MRSCRERSNFCPNSRWPSYRSDGRVDLSKCAQERNSWPATFLLRFQNFWNFRNRVQLLKHTPPATFARHQQLLPSSANCRQLLSFAGSNYQLLAMWVQIQQQVIVSARIEDYDRMIRIILLTTMQCTLWFPPPSPVHQPMWNIPQAGTDWNVSSRYIVGYGCCRVQTVISPTWEVGRRCKKA